MKFLCSESLSLTTGIGGFCKLGSNTAATIVSPNKGTVYVSSRHSFFFMWYFMLIMRTYWLKIHVQRWRSFKLYLGNRSLISAGRSLHLLSIHIPDFLRLTFAVFVALDSIFNLLNITYPLLIQYCIHCSNWLFTAPFSTKVRCCIFVHSD